MPVHLEKMHMTRSDGVKYSVEDERLEVIRSHMRVKKLNNASDPVR